MKDFKIGDTVLSIIDLWSILTTMAAVAGMAFLFGCFDRFEANFLFIFGLEDILVATIYSIICILVFCAILLLMIAAFREIVSAVVRRRKSDSNLSWTAAAPAFGVTSIVAFFMAAHLSEISKGSLNLATAIIGPVALAIGLLVGFCAVRGFAGLGFARRSSALRLWLASFAGFLLLAVTPNCLGFAYIIYLWSGSEQLTTGDSIEAGGETEQFGPLPCNQAKQILWIGAKVSVLRCDSDIVGRVNATGERFWLGHVARL